MSDANTLKVKILEKDYLVACPPDKKDALENAAGHLDEKMREIRSSGKVLGIERIAVMAALNIAYELLESGRDKEGDQEMLLSLEEKLDQALIKAKAQA
ncbi:MULTISPECIES: cell division protein ZapA [unclassified Oleiphilus]|jgi:cell division protein ZapA|uniref:cell division protein ZapA n=1 Tax=unclassified Oleiphilus TaxID=2631174 RepID=UPI0007C3DA3F|nr:MULTISPECIES: cell division protein ZapA [unclassified Oleiphilus]KZY43402.1 cell division protein ZapA [Oleiphilus sp. HI0050]KZY76839.1 cell division protein ZapA [Oleiphilus sp. HI0068]KZY79945.1 cell division protein ZapA [Oleiphilus sp. HI0069]KZY95811.1 cell division protein ZapA [Oleiphilus sp. HI0072]KZZ09529.1 cell division protein ZapA [Oleiphilus sp. HI0078]KZZ25442.1 cell division protein ZapA [Oleiphilus sp. HI0081]KZZ43435.1 cell division protein ZapA [Oleiphilus sp. HI0085]